jgi:hypothetical protein
MKCFKPLVQDILLAALMEDLSAKGPRRAVIQSGTPYVPS